MKSENQNKIGAGKQYSFDQIEKIPPLKMLLYVSMGGMGILFLVLAFSFLHNIWSETTSTRFAFPKLFSLSTVLLLVSSFFIHEAPKAYQADDLLALKRKLMWSMVLGTVFAITQVLAWSEMAYHGISFTGRAAGTYLYLLSAMHLLHLAGGLGFLSYLFLKTNRASTDSIRSLIFIRDPYRRIQIDMLRSYWHFLDVVWLFLYFTFLFSL